MSTQESGSRAGKGGGTLTNEVGKPLSRKGPESHVTRLGVIDRSVVTSSMMDLCSIFESSLDKFSVFRGFTEGCVVVVVVVVSNLDVNAVDARWKSVSTRDCCDVVLCSVDVSKVCCDVVLCSVDVSCSIFLCLPDSIRSKELSNPPSPENGSLNV